MNRRILVIIYTICVCIAFANYISLASELEFLQYWIGEARSCIASGYCNPLVVTLLEEMKFQYFLALSQFLAITILCGGFAIICLWRMEAPKPTLPVKGQVKHLHSSHSGSLLSRIRSRASGAKTRTRILTAVYTACICVAFLNYIAQKDELEYLPTCIEQDLKVLPQNFSNPTFLTNLENTKLAYFLALVRLQIVTILCAGFAVVFQWRIEALQPKPLMTEQQPLTELRSPKRSPLRLLRNKLSIKS